MSRILFRAATLDAASPDIATGLVRLSFSSELPVKRRDNRGLYYEVLSHAPGDCNLSILNRNGLLLQDHDEEKEIGEVVKNSALIDADKKARATVKVTDEKWLARVKENAAGIPVSVGYALLSVIKETRAADGISTREYSWKPYEISLLTVEPADPTVGPGRAKRQCATCDGDGDCEDCDGTGMTDPDGDEDDEENRCRSCDGKGKCGDCNGNGYFSSARSKKVDLGKLTEKQKLDLRKNIMDKTGTITIAESETLATAARDKARTETLESRNKRTKDIIAIGDLLVKDHGMKLTADGNPMSEHVRGMVTQALVTEEAVETFQTRVMTDVLGAKPAKPVLLEDCTDDPHRYSMIRGIQTAFTARERGAAGMPNGLEGEVHAEILNRSKASGGLGFPGAGFQVPANARISPTGLSRHQYRELLKTRDMQATLFGAGGAAVPTILMPPIIEILRNMMALSNVGMRTLGGLSGNVVIPRQEAAATAYSVSEIAALTASQQVLGQISLTPKRVGATENYSKQLVFQSSPDIEAFIRDDLFKVIALRWDYLGLNGQGAASEPLGILNTPGIGSVTFSATPTYIKLIAFRTAIRALNVTDPLNWLSTPNVEGTLSGVAEALTGATTVGGSQNAIWKPDNRVVGMPALATNQVPNNLMLLGAFNQFIQALWGGLDVVVDIYTLAPNAEVKLTINTWGDYACRHPQAFCLSSDSGNQ